jgi:phospholipid/cholesterol/gamma-HCH transport system substrate-binding protein
MNAMRTVVGLVVLLLLAGCEFSIYKMPLPGGADLGDDPFTVTVEFPDVLDLVPQSTVKVNDVTVGKVTDVDLDGYQAQVELSLRKDVDLPDNALAEIRQTSLLGEKFVSLRAPEQPSPDPLGNGDVIGVARTNRNPEVEEVLGALSLLLNGGGVAQLKTIASELNLALEGREGSARSVLQQIRVFMRELDQNKGDIVRAIEQLNRLAVTANRHTTDIESALDNLPAALNSLDRQRADLVKMLQALSRLGNVGTRVIKASKTVTIDALTQLQPVLTQLAAADDDLVRAFHVFYAYPFVDETVGRNPNVARNLHMGDFTNLSVQMDIHLGGGGGGGGTPADTIEDCLTNPSLEGCTQVLDDLQEQCQTTPLAEACQQLPGGGGGGDGGPLGGLPGLGSSLGLGRAPVGTTSGRVTLGAMMDDYDPVLVGLLLPGVAQ